MPTQRRNRQRKNRRNSQRRNRKNLQRGGISLFGFNFLESAEEKEKREAEEKRKKKDADLLAKNKSPKATGTDDSDTKKEWFKLPDWLSSSSKTGEPVQTGNHVDHSQIGITFDPNAANNNKDAEVRKPSFPGGKPKKSKKSNKNRSNKKR